MRRRDLLAGAAAASVAGASAAVTLGGWNPLDDGGAIAEYELAAIVTPGSETDTLVVPERGSVTFLEVFATWCDVCDRLMGPLGEMYDDFDADVRFVSVTNEPLGRTTTAEVVADWWADHDGRWPVTHDADLELTSALDATGVPYSFVLDEGNAVAWSARGYKSADELRQPIDAALAASGG